MARIQTCDLRNCPRGGLGRAEFEFNVEFTKTLHPEAKTEDKLTPNKKTEKTKKDNKQGAKRQGGQSRGHLGRGGANKRQE